MFNQKEYRHNYYLANKEYSLSVSKERYLKTKVKILERNKEKREAQSEVERKKRLDYLKAYRIKNKNKLISATKTVSAKFNQYKFSAKRRGYIFTLSLVKFTEIFLGKCGYCGEDNARGIDRVDNSMGYTEINSKPCCEMCNKLKWSWDKECFLKKIEQIYKHNSTKTK